jgi:hypothetical protein
MRSDKVPDRSFRWTSRPRARLPFIGLSVVALAVLNALSPAAEATTMRHHPLGELVQEAQRIFVGVCVAVRDGALVRPNGGSIPYTEYTFVVRDVLKGSLEERVTIRQFGTRQPRPTADGRHAVVTRVPSMPEYEPGEEFLLFLVGDSTLGLTSPVGLAQGAFRITDVAGARVAVNGFGNAGLFRGMSPAMTGATGALSAEETALFRMTRGPLGLDPLVSLVRRLAR